MKKLSLIKIYHTLLHNFGKQHWWPAETPFEVIVGAILTQNTSWNNVEKAIENLKQKKLLNPQSLSKATPSQIELAIHSSGFYKQKAKRLCYFVNYLNKKYYGNLALFFSQHTKRLRKELLSLNGIGPETADSILLYAGDKLIFVIDAYTKRILERLSSKKFKTYDRYQRYFEQNLPKDLEIYQEFHALLVELAKNYCKKKPVCQSCPIRKGCNYYAQSLQSSK